jgi:hypothetical protein
VLDTFSALFSINPRLYILDFRASMGLPDEAFLIFFLEIIFWGFFSTHSSYLFSNFPFFPPFKQPASCFVLPLISLCCMFFLQLATELLPSYQLLRFFLMTPSCSDEIR